MSIPIIGIDAEWQRTEFGVENTVLSYQWFGLDGDREWSGIFYPESSDPEVNRRLTIGQWLSKALQEGFKGKTWPKTVVLASHYTPAEMSVVKDFDKLKHRVDLIQGSSYASVKQPFKSNCYDTSRNKHMVTVHLLDSMLLAPSDGKSLAVLGMLLGFHKLELPDGYSKGEMKRLLDEQPDVFEEYALRDAEITARYIRRVEEQCGDLGLNDYRPVTVGGLATKILLKRLDDEGIDYDAVMGVVKGSQVSSGFTSTTRSYKSQLVQRHESLAVDCYHGGRNECFLFGFQSGVFTDWDLEGAYSTALAAFIEPDFDNLKETTDPNDFTHDQLGYALVKWKFPDDTRFPCLFQRDPNGHGLIYLLEGEESLTSPEIALALRMGADITIVSGVIIPAKEDGVRPFLSLSQWVNKQRKAHPKKTHPFENGFFKLIGNNVYGKVAQGLKTSSRVFDSRMGETKQLERSKVSDAYAAAYTTGLVRATTSEILSQLPNTVKVGNSITDGVCSTATESEMLEAIKGPQCQFFSSLREMICDDPKMIESKGQVDGMVFMRTRMHASTDNDRTDKNPILAAVNITLNRELSDWDKNDHLVKMFRDREWDTDQKSVRLTTARKMWDKAGDLLEEEFIRSARMDYDLKRKPIKPKMKDDHLAFDTESWPTHSEYAKHRSELDRFKDPFKLAGDLDAFFQDVHTKGSKTHRNRGKRRKNVYLNDLRDRMAVGDDGLVTPDGSLLKPRKINEIIQALSDDELEVNADQVRKTRSRINTGGKELNEAFIEVTTSVSACDFAVKNLFPDYTGKSLKRSSIKKVDD
jgi:hypothetical protein